MIQLNFDTISHPTNLNRLIPVFIYTKFPEWECQDAGISVIGSSMRRNNLECDKVHEEQYVITSVAARTGVCGVFI